MEAVVDSGRFFAVRVVGEGGMRAVLGIGFEERGEAIDFGICLQECRKVLGLEAGGEKKEGGKGKGRGEGGARRDYGLKEGQTIVVDIGRKGRRKAGGDDGVGAEGARGAEDKFFVIPPPPGSLEKAGAGAMPMLAPPPSAQDVKAEKRRSRGFEPVEKTAVELGFDDGEFGEFQ